MWTLLMTSHGRWDYLARSVRSIDLTKFDRRVLALDGDIGPTLDISLAPWFDEIHRFPERMGLTANLAQAWATLGPDEWVFHCEEDFVIEDQPLGEMAAVLDDNPDVANMVLVRQPWNMEEIASGSVLATIPGLIDEGKWLRHDRGFWLNPHVAHSSLLRTLTPGVEAVLSAQCKARGYSYGYWGDVTDPPRCVHIGAEGGMGSPGWLT